jgi:hypothetical protein
MAIIYKSQSIIKTVENLQKNKKSSIIKQNLFSNKHEIREKTGITKHIRSSHPIPGYG